MSTATPTAEATPAPEPAPRPAAEADLPTGGVLTEAMVGLGDWTVFSARALGGIPARSFTARDLLRVAVEVGVSSVGVVAVTGLFIGLVVAVQTYCQFHMIELYAALSAF